MGPYCNYCNQRCFIHIPGTAPAHVRAAYGTSTIAATCPGGKAYERSKVGFTCDDFKSYCDTCARPMTFCKCPRDKATAYVPDETPDVPISTAPLYVSALDAFWKVVSAAYPGSESVLVPQNTADAFEVMAASVVEAWINAYN